ncbi:MAG: polysaccharide deacetylase family protein, partial [Gallionellaceae bacterium]|nr:polysaccharide deacetylase family protein [Gallionellaceae bacterium]
MKQLALKIDVDTYRGTCEGVPRLVETLQRHQAQATFFFTLGPDHTGRAIKRVFRPGFIGKVSRTSVLEHYGLTTLLYGILLPGPDIGRNCVKILHAVRDAGFETGIHCYDHIRWQDYVMNKDAAWTRREMQRAVDRYTEIFGVAPRAHAAAGWQMNRHALRLMQGFGFDYSSDTRGTHPFTP